MERTIVVTAALRAAGAVPGGVGPAAGDLVLRTLRMRQERCGLGPAGALYGLPLGRSGIRAPGAAAHLRGGPAGQFAGPQDPGRPAGPLRADPGAPGDQFRPLKDRQTREALIKLPLPFRAKKW